MDATYTVTFKGFPDKFVALLDRWIEEDIAAYPKRMAMDSATVVKQPHAEAARQFRKELKSAAKKGKKNAQSR
jgi:hypothetical protein